MSRFSRPEPLNGRPHWVVCEQGLCCSGALRLTFPLGSRSIQIRPGQVNTGEENISCFHSICSGDSSTFDCDSSEIIHSSPLLSAGRSVRPSIGRSAERTDKQTNRRGKEQTNGQANGAKVPLKLSSSSPILLMRLSKTTSGNHTAGAHNFRARLSDAIALRRGLFPAH